MPKRRDANNGRREAQWDATTDRILEGALSRFEMFGIRRSRVEDVAQAAGLSRVTVYRRFPSKDALIQAVILRESDRFFVEIDALIEQFGSFQTRLVEGFAFALTYVRAHPLLSRMLASEPESIVPYLTIKGGPILEAARVALAERLGREVAEGRLAPIDIQVAAELLVRIVQSFLLTPKSLAALECQDDARTFARRYLAPALLADPGTALPPSVRAT